MDVNEKLYQYQQDAINTATPEQLTLMLYQAALHGVQQCRTTMAETPGEGLNSSQLARDILAALADNVNMEHPYGAKMRDLYLYCWRTLLTAAAEKRPADLNSVETVLNNLIQGLVSFRERDRHIQRADDRVTINFAG